MQPFEFHQFGMKSTNMVKFLIDFSNFISHFTNFNSNLNEVTIRGVRPNT